jgi:uncharacterized protein (DUF58 family)
LGFGLPAFLLWQWKGMLFVDAAILLLWAADFSMAFRKGEIQARRICSRHFLQGVTQDIQILVTNERSQKRRIFLRDQPPLLWQAPVLKGTVPGRSSLHLKYQVTPGERGVFVFDGIHLRVEGPAGLVLRPFSLESREEISVFPHFQPLRCPDLAAYRRRARYAGHRPMKRRGEGREFEALREYVEGDDLRKIHWKASARLDRPITQEFQPERNQIIMVFLDMGRLMGAVTEGRSKLDHALEAAVQLVHTALLGGDQVGFLAFADRVVCFVPPRKTRVQFQTILSETVSLKPLTMESNYEEAFLWLRSRVRRRSLVVLFTDLLDEIASENLVEAVGLIRPRHLPLCIAIRDGWWDEFLARRPSRVQEVYEKSVLQECLRQRRKAMGRLYQKGALALDLPTASLSVQAVEHYMEVKRKGLL